ncbi:acyl-CoA carboxylase epsilon subunit [Rothia sp. ARF10]|nr:acyl-CoA carboxylase epsilon subunit [Rothia sp. ARF10]
MTSSQAQSPEGPVIEVIGDATPEQVAALVAVLSAAAGAAVTEAPARHTSAWSAPAGLVRRPVAPGPGAWSRSLRA